MSSSRLVLPISIASQIKRVKRGTQRVNRVFVFFWYKTREGGAEYLPITLVTRPMSSAGVLRIAYSSSAAILQRELVSRNHLTRCYSTRPNGTVKNNRNFHYKPHKMKRSSCFWLAMSYTAWMLLIARWGRGLNTSKFRNSFTRINMHPAF